MDLSKLKEPFSAKDIEWRVAQSGISVKGKPWAQVLAYIQSRAIMDRLDEVCGPENWRNEYTAAPDGGVICKLSIRYDGEWITKEDGAENTNIEAVKGGISGALKRAGVPWGIGRYLYKLETGWAVISPQGRYKGKFEDKKNNKVEWHQWDPPDLPSWALPKENEEKPEPTKTLEWYLDDSAKNADSEETLTAWYKDYEAEINNLPKNENEKLVAHLSATKAEIIRARDLPN